MIYSNYSNSNISKDIAGNKAHFFHFALWMCNKGCIVVFIGVICKTVVLPT